MSDTTYAALQVSIILVLVLALGIAVIVQHPDWFNAGCAAC